MKALFVVSDDSTGTAAQSKPTCKVLQLLLFITTFLVNQCTSHPQPVNRTWLFQPLTFQPRFARYQDGIQEYYIQNQIDYRAIVKLQGGIISVKPDRETQSPSLELIEQREKVKWLHYDDAQGLFGANLLEKLKWIKNTLPSIKGITVCWDVQASFNQFLKKHKRYDLLTTFKSQGFEYDEMTSLNLRSPTNKILMLWKRKQGAIAIPEKSFLAISTALRLEQNMAFLREWIGYHLHLGVDKFYLHHSEQSIGYKWSTATKTKYGVELKCFGYSKERLVQEFNQLWDEYRDHIIYIPWQPKDENGDILFEQTSSIDQYTYFYDDGSEYTIFTDVDEFVFSPSNHSIKDLLLKAQRQGVTSVRILQAKFNHRLCSDHKRVTKIYEYFQANTSKWATKSIVKTDKAITGPSIHSIQFTEGKEIVLTRDILRFNHYNVKEGMIGYAHRNNFSKYKEVWIDDSMKIYDSVIDEVCWGNKCSEDFVFQCSREDFKCPVVGKVYD